MAQDKNEANDTMHRQFLIFSVDEEKFGIDIRYVTEIISMQPINQLPEVPVYVKGIINLRGKIIPVIDMCLKLQKNEATYTNRTCIIVIEMEEVFAGLIVDQVAEVLRIEDENIVLPPRMGSDIGSRYISGIAKTDHNVYLLLGCDSLFDSNETEMLSEIK